MTKKQKRRVEVLILIALALIIISMLLACGPVKGIPAPKIPATMESSRPSFID